MAYTDTYSGARVAAHAAYAQATAANLIADLILGAFRSVRVWLMARRARRELARLDQHLLSDIGLELKDVRPDVSDSIIGTRGPLI
ncbi:MAG: DUF1127 domain-containing protein [Pseudomonadota bacterium]